jgi:hypothetical protein
MVFNGSAAEIFPSAIIDVFTRTSCAPVNNNSSQVYHVVNMLFSKHMQVDIRKSCVLT